MHENIGILHGQFASNLLADTYSYFENLIPSDTDSIENINAFNNIIKDISSRLENPTKTNKNSVHNLVLYHYYALSSEDEACMRLENAITNYNKIYNKTLSLEEIEKEDNITKERIGQIINITNILDGTAISTELANEYQEFIEIFKDKTQIKNRAIQSLVILENYFNSDNKDKYFKKLHKSSKGYITIASKQNGWFQKCLKSEQIDYEKMAVGQDMYISQNTFSFPNRRLINLQEINALYIMVLSVLIYINHY